MSSRLLFHIYLVVLVLTVLKGFMRYKRLDNAMRVLFYLLILTTLSELTCLVRVELGLGKAPVYHVYTVIEIIFTTAYLLKTVKSSHYDSIMLATIVTWSALGILNCIFLQPLHKFNSNILLLESISIIGMSLYALYRILLDDKIQNVYKYPHFWIWSLQLFYWSSSFFFWGYYEVLMQRGWPFMPSFAKAQAVINILLYFGIGLTLLFYPKSPKTA